MLIGGCGCLLAAMMGLMVAYGLWIASLQPHPLPGGYPRFVRNEPDGLVSYRMQDMGWIVALPARPRELKLDPKKWSRRDQITTESYAGHEVGSVPAYSIEMKALVYRPTNSAGSFSSNRYLSLDERRFKARGGRFDRQARARRIDGVSGLEVKDGYSSDGRAAGHRGIYLFGPRSVRRVDFYYWKDDERAAAAMFERVIDSIKFVPNIKGAPWATGVGKHDQGPAPDIRDEIPRP